MKIKELVLLILILLWALLVRLWRLDFPKTQYFDEQYHVPAVQMMAEGDFATPFEWWHQAEWPIYFDWLHPPLAKYFQAAAIKSLPQLLPQVAWRLPSVLMAVGSLMLFYFLAKALILQYFLELKKSKNKFWQSLSLEERQQLALKLALMATFLLSLDGLFLVQSRLAMNDVFYLFFSLLTVLIFWQYQQRNSLLFLALSGVSLGLTLATKWTGLWLMLFLLLSESVALVKKKLYPEWPFLIFSLILLPILVYSLLYWPYFMAGKTLLDFWQLHQQIWQFQWFDAASQPDQSAAWTWMFNWRSVRYFSAFPEAGWRQDIYAQGNPVLFIYFWLSLLGLARLFWQKLRHAQKQLGQLITPTLVWLMGIFFSSFLPWILVGRGMFFYHFLPALPWIIILTTIFLALLFEALARPKRLALYFHSLFWPSLTFLIFYPHWTALRVPEAAALLLYFLPPNWR